MEFIRRIGKGLAASLMMHSCCPPRANPTPFIIGISESFEPLGNPPVRARRDFSTTLDAKETLLICELNATPRIMEMPDGYTVRFPRKDGPSGAYGAIAFKEKHWKIFQNDVQPEARAKLQVTMGAWCRDGPQHLPPQKFKFEKHYEKSGKKTRIDVFKTRHVRFYGAVVDVNGKPTFLVTGADISKKADQADQDILENAGKGAHALIHTVTDRQKK